MTIDTKKLKTGLAKAKYKKYMERGLSKKKKTIDKPKKKKTLIRGK
tara:strand:- start:336 stop:473 length:138 start_codon:yes stop_codon:yes gene_type:complete